MTTSLTPRGIIGAEECIFNNELDNVENTFWISISEKNEDYCRQLTDVLLSLSLNDLKEKIKDCEKCYISAKNIPQFSNYENGTINILQRLRMAGDFGPTFVELGEQFSEPGKKEAAYKKYGENHAKIAELLGLVKIIRESNSRVYLTQLGKVVESYTIDEQERIIERLILRIPIIKYLIKEQKSCSEEVTEALSLFLAESTAKRRKSNVERLLKVIDMKE